MPFELQFIFKLFSLSLFRCIALQIGFILSEPTLAFGNYLNKYIVVKYQFNIFRRNGEMVFTYLDVIASKPIKPNYANPLFRFSSLLSSTNSSLFPECLRKRFVSHRSLINSFNFFTSSKNIFLPKTEEISVQQKSI